MMDTKMQALEKAQEMQRNNVNNRCSVNDYNNPTRFEVINGGSVIGVFKYSNPKPLEKDTLVKEGSVFRWAFGELDDNGINLFYPKGWNSKSNIAFTIDSLIPVRDFEIIETPGEFERVQTPDNECINSGCTRYVNKWQRVESEKFLNGDCERCRVPIGTPSKLQVKK